MPATEDRYNYLYTERELRPFAAAAQIQPGATSKKAYLFFNNHFSAQGVANAVQLRRQLGQPVVEPLPPDLARAFPWLKGPTLDRHPHDAVVDLGSSPLPPCRW